MSRDRVAGVIQNNLFGISDPNSPIHYITFMGLRWRLRGVYMEHPHCKAFFGRKFCPANSGPQNGGFSGIRGLNVKVLFSNPQKAHPCILHESCSGASAVSCRKNQQKKKPSKHFWCAVSRILGKEAPWGIVPKFYMLFHYPGPHHVYNFWWWSVKGFGHGYHHQSSLLFQ